MQDPGWLLVGAANNCSSDLLYSHIVSPCPHVLIVIGRRSNVLKHCPIGAPRFVIGETVPGFVIVVALQSWRESDALQSADSTENRPPGGGCGGGLPGRKPPNDTPRSPLPRRGALENRPATISIGGADQVATYFAAVSGPAA